MIILINGAFGVGKTNVWFIDTETMNLDEIYKRVKDKLM